MPKQKSKKELEDLIKENVKKTNLLVKEVKLLNENIKKSEIMNYIRFLIVVIPAILAFLYLIPLFREMLEIYQPLVNFLDQVKGI